MKKRELNSLIYGFSATADAIKKLETSGLLSVRVWIEHATLHGTLHGTHKYNDLLFGTNQKVDIKYDIPTDLYIKIFDKHFNLFLSNLSRIDSYTGLHSAYPYATNLFNVLVSKLYDMLVSNEIDVVIHSQYPHEVVDTLVFVIAKEIGIATLMMPPLFYVSPARFFITEEFYEYGLWKERPIVDQDVKFDLSQFGMTQVDLKKHAKTGYLQKIGPIFKSKFPRGIYNRILAQVYRYNLRAKTSCSIDLSSKDFVYFPLHYQPEASICAQSHIVWEDQLLLIEKLAKRIPDNWLIVIKENPMQTFYYRDQIFFDRISCISNVVIVPASHSSRDLVANSKCVATVTGTVGWEALARGIPVIYSGFPLYREISGAYRYNDDLNFSAILATPIQKSVVIDEGSEMLKRAYRGNPTMEVGEIDDSDANCELVADAIKCYIEAHSKRFEHGFAARSRIEFHTGNLKNSGRNGASKNTPIIRWRYALIPALLGAILSSFGGLVNKFKLSGAK